MTRDSRSPDAIPKSSAARTNAARLSRRAFLGAGAASGALALASPLGAQTAPAVVRSPYPVARPSDLWKRAVPSGAQVVADARLGGAVSAAVADAATGVMLDQFDGADALPPASVAKVITALYALEHLGADHRFGTQVIATGPVAGGIVQGDLVLAGGGDPTLDSDGLVALVAQLKAAGITGVSGAFRVWDGALPQIERIDSDQTDYAGYNPAISGLNLNYNRVNFEWRKQGGAYAVSMDARAATVVPAVRVASVSIVARSTPLFAYRADATHEYWSVAQEALGNGGSRWLPVRRPALYAGDVFATLAAAQGVRLGPVQEARGLSAGTVVASVASAPLTVIVKDMLKYSTNLTAEVLGLATTRARGGQASTLKASAGLMSDWAQARFGVRSLSFVDHSGLGGASRITGADMVRVLVAPGVEARLAPLLKAVAVEDEGVSVVAKTGTLDFASALAGYVEVGGKRLAFASFAADLPARRQAQASAAEVPVGARTYNSRAKALHRAWISRWSTLYAV
ncbi:D-alanyl-D-alanine carboxypeptidase DacB precursor [Aquimixticola soesokkakensis]|uniref:D-alanyl-D-alanine carboxypeptidase DacB n=1 Tax=Aquimixticola soesokkakensis TaxID=1519096 RepID=A0A1Y5TCU7_9RHOB|nr:D-alanyl-D-alanine carboxypeptidase/D-alanyl-D-alanine-endopeptidase [Aquimixticola soesokkakensis]SLN60674.1 D-alanyl-D-alanine carboxypeptidase DacB precursor [Aquimixticola soesokkakensis]